MGPAQLNTCIRLLREKKSVSFRTTSVRRTGLNKKKRFVVSSNDLPLDRSSLIHLFIR